MSPRWVLAVLAFYASSARAQQTLQPASLAAASGSGEATRSEAASYQLGYLATDGCPSRDEFIHYVAARVPSARLVTGADDADFVVSLTLSPARSVLTIQKRSGEKETRPLEVDSCLEAGRAAALILAVTLDPNAAGGSIRADVGASAEPSADRDSSPPPVRRRFRRSEPRSVRPGATASPPASPPPASRGWRLELGAGESGDLRTGLTPKPALGGSVLALASLGRLPPRSGLEWAPSAMLHVGLTASSTAERSGVGSASFSWMGGALSLCPARIGVGARFGILPCVALDAGRLHAEGNPNPKDILPLGTNVAVFAPGARLWARWWLADWVDLVASVGAAWPTRRYKYWMPTISSEPREVHQLSSPAYSAGLGLVAVRR